MSKFELVPDQKVVEEKQVTKQYAHAWFNIYRQGVELDAKVGQVTVDGDTLEVSKSSAGYVRENTIEFANNYEIKTTNLQTAQNFVQ